MAAGEQGIHQAIHIFLKHALPVDAVEFAVDSAGKASFVVAAKLKSRGGRKGTPDHYILWRGRSIWLEVKTEVGRASPEQIAMAAAIRNAGGACYLIRGVTDAETVLLAEGVPLRATSMTARERDERLTARESVKARKVNTGRSKVLPGRFDRTPFDGPELL